MHPRTASLLAILTTLVMTGAEASPRNRVSLQVVLTGRPAAGFRVEYRDGDRKLRATTDARGFVSFEVSEPLREWDLASSSEDYVFRDLRGNGRRWTVRAVRSAIWRQRTLHRPCDEWRNTIDIPRGSLYIESADEYDVWYSSLSPESEANCLLLAKTEPIVGSKAPWLFYEFKAMPPGCVDGRYVAELDWTAWYRHLLEEATGARPGPCVSNWEQWWAKKGYPPLPHRPSGESPPN
jgi:hypothetical protein